MKLKRLFNLIVVFVLVAIIITMPCCQFGEKDSSKTDKEKQEEVIDEEGESREEEHHGKEPEEQQHEQQHEEQQEEQHEEHQEPQEENKFDSEAYLSSLKYGKSIEYSNEVKNKVSGYFNDKDKRSYHLENKNVALDYNLKGENKNVSNIYNKSNNLSYAVDTFDTYIVKNGEKKYSKNSKVNARENTFKLGYYYYNTHFLGQTFENFEKVGSGLSLLKNENISYTYDVKNLNLNNEKLTFDISSPYDPQIVFKTNYLATEYNVLHVRLKSPFSSSFQIYMASDKKDLCAEQIINTSISENKDFEDFFVILSRIPNYEGTIKKLRIDIGSKLDEHIEITKFELLKVDLGNNNFSLNKTFHIYGDKLYQEDTVLSTLDGSIIEDAGCEIRIKKDTVESYVLLDKDEMENTTNQKASVAFKIKNVGVLGVILPFDKGYTVNLSLNSDYYILDIKANIEDHEYNELESFNFGFRIYTDSESDFSAFKKESFIEHNPLGIEIFEVDNNSKAIGYDSIRGCYVYTIDGAGFNQAFYSTPQKQFKINGKITSLDDRKVYVLGGCYNSGNLENSVVLDENGLLIPIQTQNCKNFMGEHEEPVFDKDDLYYGEAIFPLSLTGNQDYKFTLIHLYQNWGQMPLKQLSSIQYYTEYYHLSTGVTETNCIASEVDNYLPDFRSMSAVYWESQPQHTSFGSNVLTRYTDINDEVQKTIHLSDEILSSGPTYADLKLDFISTDGKIKCSYRHTEMPQTDENRTYYEIDYEVLEPISFEDFKKQFSIFSANSLHKSYKSFGYLDKNNLLKIVSRSLENSFNDVYVLGNKCPYFDMYDCTNSSDYVNLGILIKNYNIYIDNKNVETEFVVRSRYDAPSTTNYIDLSLNFDSITLNKGDKMHFEIVLVPWGDQNTVNDDNIRELRKNTLLKPFSLSVEKGKIIEDTFLNKIEVDKDSQVAVFTISEGKNVASNRIFGFNELGRLFVEEYVDGEWVKFNNNYYEYDGYMVYFDEDKTFSYSFNVDMGEENNGRTFRVSIIK